MAKIHEFRCNICEGVFGLDDDPRIEGFADDLSTIVNPRDADIHICEICLVKITKLGMVTKFGIRNYEKEVDGEF